MHTHKKTVHIDIVSAEQEIFSGDVESVIATGEGGELGIMPGHTPLLTKLKAGAVRLFKEGNEDFFFVSGGILEVQPHMVTVLADTIARAADLDEMAAIAAKERAEKLLSDKKADIDYSLAATELAEAMAQLRVISQMKDRLGIK